MQTEVKPTSLMAYKDLKESGLLSTRRWQAYETLYLHGPLTGQELGRLTGVPGMWKRCSELARIGVVTARAPRVCCVTGRVAIAWAVTAQKNEEETQP